MARLSIIIGIGLMLTAAMGYSMAHQSSVTALIPAFIGIFMALSGLIIQHRPSLSPHLMHLNTILAILAMGGAASRLPYAMINPSAHWVQLLVLSEVVFLSALFIFLSLRSFVMARQVQKQGTQPSPSQGQ